MTRAITTSGEYVGGPLDSVRPAVELDTAGQPPTTLAPAEGDLFAPNGLMNGGHYAIRGKTEAGRHRYIWVPARRDLPRPTRKRDCCETPGRGCPMWQPS